MPATVASERVFSKAGDVITRKSNTLALSKANTHFSDGQSVTFASLLGR